MHHRAQKLPKTLTVPTLLSDVAGRMIPIMMIGRRRRSEGHPHYRRRKSGMSCPDLLNATFKVRYSPDRDRIADISASPIWAKS
jgi:hypothetical protein